jgi:hypothetical protein
MVVLDERRNSLTGKDGSSRQYVGSDVAEKSQPKQQ